MLKNVLEGRHEPKDIVMLSAQVFNSFYDENDTLYPANKTERVFVYLFALKNDF